MSATETTLATTVSARPGPQFDCLTRILYFRGLGLVFLIAFLSLWVQIHGLIGQEGILPAKAYFKLAADKLGTKAYWLLPSLCWFNTSDFFLHMLCALGTLLSVILAWGKAPRIVLSLLWLIYLSLSVAGQAFLSFQWDTLLLEMSLCSWIYAPPGLVPDWKKPASTPMDRWLLWALSFKLMFLSGVTKLLSDDSSWHDGTALQFHYYTQPIPSWTAWHACQFPIAFHKVCLLGMFAIEVFLPFLIFTGRTGRSVFGLATIALMIAIEATGNFGFFNLQTIILAIPLLNDGMIRRVVLQKWQTPIPNAVAVVRSRWRSSIIVGFSAVSLLISALCLLREMAHTIPPGKNAGLVATTLQFADRSVLSWSEPAILNPIAPFRTINGYGLFRVMTTRRPEILIEISRDGQSWEALEFRYKPGPILRAPPIVAPHMPRLDWQMWFAALNPRGNGYWLDSLCQRILEGNPKVAQLLGRPQLARDPPDFIRLTYYDYKFSSPEQRSATGAWWARSEIGPLSGVISRRRE